MKRRLLLLGLLMLAGCGGGGGTTPPTTADYFSEMNPSLRWSSTKTANPLKVFIGLDGATDRSATVMTALNAWTTGTSNLVRFEQVNSIGAADIPFEFSDTVPNNDGGLGETEVSFNVLPSNPTVDGTITKVAITLKTGQITALLLPVVEHEGGHALGLVARNPGDVAHSSYSGDLMYAVVTTSSALSSRDIATLVKLYALSRSR